MTEKTLREAAQMALEALEHHQEQTRPILRTEAAIEALRAALALPDEPVERKPLTKDQRLKIEEDNVLEGSGGLGGWDYNPGGIIDDVEAAHGIKGAA